MIIYESCGGIFFHTPIGHSTQERLVPINLIELYILNTYISDEFTSKEESHKSLIYGFPLL